MNFPKCDRDAITSDFLCRIRKMYDNEAVSVVLDLVGSFFMRDAHNSGLGVKWGARRRKKCGVRFSIFTDFRLLVGIQVAVNDAILL